MTMGSRAAVAAGLVVVVVCAIAGAGLFVGSVPVLLQVRRVPGVARSAAVRVWGFVYRAHDGSRRTAYVVLPAWYGPGRHPTVPLVIAPHGRGVGPRANVRLWGDLPAIGSFALVSPEGEGMFSWGAPGQISDLAEMPALVRTAMPWLRVDRRRVYAVGGSMGGQETLLLVAEHPRLLAGAAAFDSVADFGYQYREFPFLRCNVRCLHVWREPVGRALQTIARREIGGTPASDPSGYAARSPLTYARQIARSRVPIELWWSRNDRIVRNQQEQSGELFQLIKQINPKAAIERFVGSWAHTAEMRSTSRLPFALAELGLLSARYDRWPRRADYPSRPSMWPKLVRRTVD